MRPSLEHLESARSLETTYEAIRAGFLVLALEKNRQATPFIAQARALKIAAGKAHLPKELLGIPDIKSGLLTAAGISDKATNYLQESDKHNAVCNLIEKFLEPAGGDFVEEIVFRFLLTRGDTLGGSMRNIGGFMAQRRLTRAILAYLKIAGHRFQWLHRETKAWAEIPEDDVDVELFLSGLCWNTGKGQRTLLYNITVPFFRNNVDLLLLDCPAENLSREIISTPAAYLALGELKGGIDPAGADEHWKTARTALKRIHEAFAEKGLKPYTFFVGAAIEAKMAKEIWEMLKSGRLDNAANLSNDTQLAAVSKWLCTL